MVEKRTLAFISLGALVWAVSVSGLAAYLHLENAALVEQISETQQSLDKMVLAYDASMNKYNTLQREYSSLYGSYSFPFGVNFTQLIVPLGSLVAGLEGNYSSILMGQDDLNEAYDALCEGYQEVCEKGNEITREDFGAVLSGLHELLDLLTIRELSAAISETVTLEVSVCVDYGNETIEWHNETEVSTGYSLFQLTREVTVVNEDDYAFFAWTKPGHIIVNTINDIEAYAAPDFSEGWSWMWYYWDDSKQDWVPGMVGCDAWIVEKGGTYKWQFEHWSYP